MPVLKTKVGGEWVPLVAGRDGAQGPPGPASPHEGSNIAVGVRQYGAVGDGTTDDTAAIQAAIKAAGSYGFVDFEAGTYLVTSALSSWLNIRKTGPGALTNGAIEQYVTPRYDGDLYVLHVDGTSGSDLADGMFPHSAFKTFERLDEVFSKMDSAQVDRGRIVVRLSGEFEGHRFAALPHTRLPILFEGEPLVNGEPVTTIRRVTAQIGIHVQPAVGRTVTFRNLAFKDFTGGSGFGMLWAQGGSVRVENCLAEDCGTGFVMRDNANMSVLDTTARRCTTSGFRSQYFANGAWTRCTATACNEGFHVSRNSVMHVDYCVAEDSTRNGLWMDMAARVQSIASTYRRNGWHGIRGEGNATVDVNQTTAGGNIFGTGADKNGIKDVSVMGGAVLAVDEGIHAIPEHLTATKVGSWTSAVTADRGLRDYRIGRDARMRVRVWGTGGGTGTSLRVGFGSTNVHTRNLTTNQWMVEVTLLYSGTGWQGIATLNGAGNGFPVIEWPSGEAKPTFTPTGATIRGFEVYVGG